MNRWIPRILICMVLGAATTLGVAWGIAFFSTAWAVDTAVLVVKLRPSSHGILDASGAGYMVVVAETADSRLISTLRTGWPWLALESVEGEGTLGRAEAEIVALMRTPLLPGIVFNSLFYATMWYLLCVTVYLVRQSVRRMRGRCPRCAFDVRGAFADGCPECGWNRKDFVPRSPPTDRRIPPGIPTFVGRYLQVIGVVQLIGLNPFGFLHYWLGAQVYARDADGRIGAIWLCAFYFLATLVAGGFMVAGAISASATIRVFGIETRAVLVVVLFMTIFGVLHGLPLMLLLLPSVRRRYLPGACPACGYELLGEYTRGCPECGWGRECRPTQPR